MQIETEALELAVTAPMAPPNSLPTEDQDVSPPATAGSDRQSDPIVASKAPRYRSSNTPSFTVAGAYHPPTSSIQARGLDQEKTLVHDPKNPRRQTTSFEPALMTHMNGSRPMHDYPRARNPAHNIPLDSGYQAMYGPSSNTMQWPLGDTAWQPVNPNNLGLESGPFPKLQHPNTFTGPYQRASRGPSSLAYPFNEAPFHGPAGPTPFRLRLPETVPPAKAPKGSAEYAELEGFDHPPPRRRKVERLEDYDPNDPTQVAPDYFPKRRNVRVEGFLFGRSTGLKNVVLDSGAAVSVIDARIISARRKWDDVFSCEPAAYNGMFGGRAVLDRQIDYVIYLQTSKGLKYMKVRAYVAPAMSQIVVYPIVGTSDIDRNDIDLLFTEKRAKIGKGKGSATFPINIETQEISEW